MEDKIFRFSLIISALLHALILVGMLYTRLQYEDIKAQTIEVIYQYQIQEKKETLAQKMPQKGIEKLSESMKPEILSMKERAYSPSIDSLVKPPMKVSTHKKQPLRVPSVGEKRNVVVPIIESEKISNPKYIDYHDRIRTKIKNRAYFYVDDPRFDIGEVYLTFVLASDGSLKAIKIIDDKTRANDYLRNVGLRSIKESSPFPQFPSDLKYPELTFNVVISFEITK